MKKILPWLALGIAVLWIIHNPAGAAAAIHQLLSSVTTFASGL